MVDRKTVKLAIALGMGLWVGGCANTVSYAPQPQPQQPATYAARSLPDGGTAAVVPAGYIDFCMRFAADCRQNPYEPDRITLDAANWTVLQTVNAQVNNAIWSQDDDRHYGRAEYWTIPTDGYGDCEDYALTKRRDLVSKGLPGPALRLAIVVTPRVGLHTVLTIATDRGDFVLDNLTDRILPWNQTDYVWLERQNPKVAFGWTALNAPSLMAQNAGTPTASAEQAEPAAAVPPLSEARDIASLRPPR